jgi:preprotein translocase subunit SecB
MFPELRKRITELTENGNFCCLLLTENGNGKIRLFAATETENGSFFSLVGKR